MGNDAQLLFAPVRCLLIVTMDLLSVSRCLCWRSDGSMRKMNSSVLKNPYYKTSNRILIGKKDKQTQARLARLDSCTIGGHKVIVASLCVLTSWPWYRQERCLSLLGFCGVALSVNRISYLLPKDSTTTWCPT